MITHVVLLQPKSDVTEEQIATVLAHVQNLRSIIPEIQSVQTGKNLNRDESKNKGYVYGFVMQFATLAHLRDAYAPHPEHKIVGAELRSISQNIIDFDIELE